MYLMSMDQLKYIVCNEYMPSIIFFFKQKTAYELRISDWSSDVCSSDLQISGLSGAVGFEQGRLDFAVGPAPVQRLNPRSAPLGHRAPAAVTFEHARPARRDAPIGDRKSVVQGTRVSVRVHLGVRSNLNKTKKYSVQTPTTTHKHTTTP